MQLSKAQATLLHTVESAASGAILTLLVGIVQYLSTHQLNGQDLLMIFGAGFAGAFGLLYKSVVNSPVLPQAEADTITEAKQLAQKAIGHIEDMWPILRGLQATQKAATPAIQPTNLLMPQNVAAVAQSVPVSSNVLQAAFPGTQLSPAATTFFPTLNTGTQSMPPATTVYTGTVNLPTSLPPRSWTDTALTQAVMPQPPRG